MRRTSEVFRALLWSFLLTSLLAILVVIGSRNLSHFDAALVGYTFAVLFATFGITYRYVMWLMRPPTRMYWKRGWQMFAKRGYRLTNLKNWVSRLSMDVFLNRFIQYRGTLRWLAHVCIMWGCILAVAITFPLVFGWIHFQTVPGNYNWYRVFFFGFPTFSFPIDSPIGFFIFHGLVWASILVIAGVMLAVRRRILDQGAAVLQEFMDDFLPLILLFSVSITGLMLTASYTWMKGYAYDFLAILHAITVIFTLLWLPFGKFFHIFQRPAQLGVTFYKDVGSREKKAQCRRCRKAFTSMIHVQDLIQVEEELGYRYEIPDSEKQHYQWICPPCRRALLAIAQGNTWKRTTTVETPSSTHANPQTGFGPLGHEDEENFHP